jgi:hypothetical protein
MLDQDAGRTRLELRLGYAAELASFVPIGLSLSENRFLPTMH